MPKNRFGLFQKRTPNPEQTGDLLPLSDLLSGGKGLVHSLAGGRSHSSRLASMGLTSGAEVVVMQNYGRGPLILSVRGVRLAIGHNEAEKILVRKL